MTRHTVLQTPATRSPGEPHLKQGSGQFITTRTVFLLEDPSSLDQPLPPFPPCLRSLPASVPSLPPFPPCLRSLLVSVPSLPPFPPCLSSLPVSVPFLDHPGGEPRPWIGPRAARHTGPVFLLRTELCLCPSLEQPLDPPSAWIGSLDPPSPWISPWAARRPGPVLEESAYSERSDGRRNTPINRASHVAITSICERVLEARCRRQRLAEVMRHGAQDRVWGQGAHRR